MKPPNSKSKIDNQQVWRFVGYRERFGYEPPPGLVKLPQYIKWHINAWDGVGGDVMKALTLLRREKDYIWLQGAIVELLTVCTNAQPQYQGYLLTSRKTPASASEIGSMLRETGRGSPQKVSAALKKLERAGVLEQVPWEPVDSGPIADTGGPQSKRVTTSKRKKKGGKKPASRAENEGKALRNYRNGETAAQNSFEGGKEKGPPGGGQPFEPGAEPAQTPRRLSDSTTPTSSDAGAGPGPARTVSGHPGRHAGPASTIHIRDALAARRKRARYSPEAMDFAHQVIAASGFITPDRPELANELAHWAKPFEKMVAHFDSSAVRSICAKLLRVATNVRADRGAYQNPQKYLMTTLKNTIRDARRAGKAVGA